MSRALSIQLRPDLGRAAQEVNHLCRRLALADAIFAPDPGDRWFSYARDWDEDRGCDLATWGRLGEEELLLVLSLGQMAAKGFVARAGDGALLSVSDIRETLPESCFELLSDPSIELTKATFVAWHEASWCVAPAQADLSLLEPLKWSVREHLTWAEIYHGLSVPPEALEQLWSDAPLTPDLLRDLNPACSPELLEEELASWGMAARLQDRSL